MPDSDTQAGLPDNCMACNKPIGATKEAWEEHFRQSETCQMWFRTKLKKLTDIACALRPYMVGAGIL